MTMVTGYAHYGIVLECTVESSVNIDQVSTQSCLLCVPFDDLCPTKMKPVGVGCHVLTMTGDMFWPCQDMSWL